MPICKWPAHDGITVLKQDLVHDGNRKVLVVDGADGSLISSHPHNRAELTNNLQEFFVPAKSNYVNISPAVAKRLSGDATAVYEQIMFAFNGALYSEE